MGGIVNIYRIRSSGTIITVHTMTSFIYQSIDQPGKVANPARGQLNKENEYSPVPVLLVSRDGFGRLVPRQPSHFPQSG